MGQGLSTGFIGGCALQATLTGATLPLSTHLAIIATTTAAGFSVDLLSDATARVGKINIERDVVLNASDHLKHLYSYYTRNCRHCVARIVHQKHEWVVLESETNKFYTVQKNPLNADVQIHVRPTLRAANDCGLYAAGMPGQTGEIQLHRADQEFDVNPDCQVAYLIAWCRKEDPRWAFSTENSRHFTMRLRLAMNDF